jgi:hypothetical protein
MYSGGPTLSFMGITVIQTRHQLGLRAIQGVLRLKQKYSNEKINAACQQALRLGSLHYHTVQLLCSDPNNSLQHQQLELLQEHELIRSPEAYQHLIHLLEQTHDS